MKSLKMENAIGCIGLQYDIDKLKLECEDYKKYTNKGEQMKL